MNAHTLYVMLCELSSEILYALMLESWFGVGVKGLGLQKNFDELPHMAPKVRYSSRWVMGVECRVSNFQNRLEGWRDKCIYDKPL